MNTIGKILVLLNLVFALVTGGFLVVDFAARRNWQQEAEQRKALILTAQSSRDAALQQRDNLLTENKKLREDLDSHLIESKGESEKLGIRLKDLEKAYKDQEARAAKADENALKSDAQAQRLQKEVKLLTELVAKREDEIRKAQDQSAELQRLALSKATEAQTALARARNLLEQLKQRELEIAKLQQGPAMLKTASIRDPNYSNPPPADVKGKIAKIHSEDRSLVELNIGSDVGVNKDNTLDVYRLEPRAAYLGRLLIVESFPHRAIARLVRRGVSTPPLQVGDEVASRIR